MAKILKKLHLTIPVVIFDAIYNNDDMEEIDDIVTGLLARYYGVDLNGKQEK